MTICVIIPVHNRKERTQDCLLCFEKQSEKSFRIVLIDDGSTDGTAEMVAKEFPTVEVLYGNGNLWWSGSVNLGIQHVLSSGNPNEFILLVNDDLVVPADFIANAYLSASKYPNTLIGSVIIDSQDHDSIFGGGTRINWTTAKWQDLNRGKKLSDFSPAFTIEVSTLTGRGVLIPIEVFKKVGLYNSKHMAQCGDTELPVRAARAGYRLRVDYSMIVYHDTNEKDHISYRDHYKLSDAKDYFFSVRSHTYFKDRFWFAVCTSSNIIKILRYLILDFIRITIHFILRLRWF